MDFIWSLYIAATVRVKAVQELQQQQSSIMWNNKCSIEALSV